MLTAKQIKSLPKGMHTNTAPDLLNRLNLTNQSLQKLLNETELTNFQKQMITAIIWNNEEVSKTI